MSEQTEILTPLGAWLKAERGRAAEMARQIKCSKGQVSDVSQGKTRPGTQTLIDMAQHTGLTLNQILAPWMSSHAAQCARLSDARPTQTTVEIGAAK